VKWSGLHTTVIDSDSLAKEKNVHSLQFAADITCETPTWTAADYEIPVCTHEMVQLFTVKLNYPVASQFSLMYFVHSIPVYTSRF